MNEAKETIETVHGYQVSIPNLGGGYAGVLQLKPAMLKLLEIFAANNVKVDSIGVGLGEAGYYAANDGCYGWIGYIPEEQRKNIGFFQDGVTTLWWSQTTDFDVLKQQPELCQRLRDNLTKGGRGKTYSPINVRGITQREISKIGIYKRPNFDEVYQALKKVYPDLSAAQCAKMDSRYEPDEYNYDLVMDRPYDGDMDLIDIEERTSYEPTGTYTTYYGILTPDIEPNLQTLLELVTAKK
jgi:hypothetical protein